ncbi:hypothetical protein WNZ14_21465 [Hoeflea sp. AS60]|uniref:hypothetical protein n=1 Tax=Hoeflea sp. AS60 TaxID=3135780 RepID=UPI003181C6C8
MSANEIISGDDVDRRVRQRAGAGLGFGVRFFIVYLTGLIMVLADLADGKIFHDDVDNHMRALQIRTVMSSAGHWFDLTLPMIATPDAYVSPWSRLIDLPYVVIAKILESFLPPSAALEWAFLIWPPLMLAIFSWLCVLIIARLLGGFQLSGVRYSLVLALTMVLMVTAVLEFAPGRIDHHNVQIITMLAVLLGLLRWDRAGGWLIGAGSALSVVVGLECLPFVVIAFSGLVVCYLFAVRGAEQVLAGAAAAMLATSVVCAAAFLGPNVALAQCDAFSAPYLMLMIGGSLILFAASRGAASAALPVKLLVLGLPTAALLGAVAWLYPSCLQGPYQVIDPLSRALWFNRIWQEESFLLFYRKGQYEAVLNLALQAMMIACAVPFMWARAKRDPGLVISLLIAAAALVLTLIVTRYIRFPAALAPLFLPAIIAHLISGESVLQRRWAGGLSAGVIGTASLLYVTVPPIEWSFDSVDFMSFDECKDQDFSVLSKVAPGRIAVPLGLSMPLAEVLPDGFSIANVPFHRAAPGMKRMFETFTTADPDVRRAALAPFDYLAVCRFKLRSEDGDTALYATLSAGGDWPGLIRIAPERETDFQLFRIDHVTLR